MKPIITLIAILLFSFSLSAELKFNYSDSNTQETVQIKSNNNQDKSFFKDLDKQENDDQKIFATKLDFNF